MVGTRAWTLVAAAGFFCWSVQPAISASLTVKDLLEKGDRYHQQFVSVTGQVTDVKALIGPRNLPFYTFVLRDTAKEAGNITVIMQGKSEVSGGDQVLVHGIFFKSRKAGRSTITNRIEATIVQQLHDQRQPLIG